MVQRDASFGGAGFGDAGFGDAGFGKWADRVAVACFLATPDAELIAANHEWSALTGIEEDQAVGAGWLDAVHLEDRERLVAGWQQAAMHGKRFATEFRARTPLGERWLSCTAARPTDDSEPEGGAIVGWLSDITSRVELEGALERALMERVRAMSRLRAQQAKLRQFRQAFDSSPLATAICDLDGRMIEVNDALCSQTGHSREELSGMATDDLMPKGDRTVLGEVEGVEVLDAGEGLRVVESDPEAGAGTQATFECRLLRKDGVERWVRSHAVVVYGGQDAEPFVVMLNTDVTEDREREARLHHDASHDALTGIPNRTLLFDLVEQALARAARQRTNAALLFLDLDHFKAVNDNHGHGAGDSVLQETTRRLRDAVRVGDTVGRYGGDEFAVLCEGLTELGDAAVVARRICRHLAEDIILPDGYIVRVGASVGVALSTGTESVSDLFEAADRALYEAKKDGRGRHVVAGSRVGAGSKQGDGGERPRKATRSGRTEAATPVVTGRAVT